MDFMDGEGPPPPELSLVWQCERYHCLPDAGAYFDQDYGLMVRMTACSNVYGAVSQLRNSQGKQIHSLSSSTRRVLRALVDKGLLFSG